jgi:hypothetical protein
MERALDLRLDDLQEDHEHQQDEHDRAATLALIAGP